jgi:putative peptidase
MKRHLYHYIGHAALLWAAWLVCVPLAAQSLSDSIKLPADIVEGRLDNGLRYLLKKNGTPTSRTEFRLIMHVGSVQEAEHQKGGAHFLEHIAFGGTRHFPNRGAVQYLESLGMKYGQDINAYTGFDRTIYMFAVPSDKQKDSSYRKPLLILRDWLTDMTINPQRVETEKGIILEELRGYDIGDDFYDLKIGQGIFKDRMPLGNTEDIRQMTAATLREYYRTWYVPELATLLIVGDIEPKAMEKEIRRMFDIKKKKQKPNFRTYPLVYTAGTQISQVVDSLQLRDEVELMIPHPCIITQTLEDVRKQGLGQALVSAISHRFQKRSIRCDVSNKWYLSDKEHLVFTVREGADNDLPERIAALSNELKNILENGFHPKEVERAVNTVIRQLENTDYEGMASTSWCDELTDYVLSGDCHINDSLQVSRVAEAMREASSQDFQALLNEWLAYRNNALLVAGRVHPYRTDRLTEEYIRKAWKDGEKLPCQPFEYEETVYEPVQVDAPACLEVVRPFDASCIADTRTFPELGIRDVRLTNGIRLILKPTRENGNILLTSLAPGGIASITADRFYQLESTASYIDLGGIAKADYNQLQDYLFQHNMALSLMMEGYWHGLMGFFEPQDATAFFNLVYEKITDPELRYEDFEDIRKELRSSLGKETLLDKMLSRTPDRLVSARINTLMGNTAENGGTTPEEQDIDRLNLDSIAHFYKRLYNEPNRTTYILCGKFDPDTLTRQFAAVFSQMPRVEQPEEWTVPPVRLPEQPVVERFPNDNETQTIFDYLYFGHYEPGLRNSLILKLMNSIVRNRLISDLRERESLVYSPYISLFYDGAPKSQYYFDINASVDNRNMPKVQSVLRNILQTLREKPVTDEELNTLKQSFLINKREALDESNTAVWRTTLTGLLKNGESLEDFARYEDCLNSITPADLLEAFRSYFDLDRYVLLYISNQEIEKQ